MGKFHSFTGHKIIERLKEDSRTELLNHFRQAAMKKPNREHLVWEDCLDENIYTERVLIEKIEYIHNNPINKGWELAATRSEYAYSSACHYDLGKPALIEIDNIRDVLR